MSGFYNSRQSGKPVRIRDDGIIISDSVSEIDFVGDGVSGSAIGDLVEEEIPGGDLGPYWKTDGSSGPATGNWNLGVYSLTAGNLTVNTTTPTLDIIGTTDDVETLNFWDDLVIKAKVQLNSNDQEFILGSVGNTYPISLVVNDVTKVYISSTDTKILSNLIFGTDNSYDIGTTSAFRPRTGYFGTSLYSPYIESTATLGAEQMPALTTGNWTLGTGWAYQTSPNRVSKTSNGTGTATTTAATTIVAGTTYKVEIIVDSISGGTVSVSLGGFTGQVIYSTGTKTFYITANTTGKIIFTPSDTAVRIAMSGISVKPLTDATGDLDVYGNARFFSPITNPLIVTTNDKGPSVIFNAYNNNTGERLFDFTRNWVPYLSSDQYGGVKIGNSNSTGQFTVDPGWFNGSGNFAALSKFTNSNTGTGAGHQVQIATLGGGNVSLLLSAASVDRMFGVDQGDGLNCLKIANQNSFNSVNDNLWLRQDAYTANGARLSIGNNPGNKSLTASNGDVEAWAEGATIGANVFTNGTFTGSAASWTLAGGFAYGTNNVVYTHSGGTGTLTQAYASFATAVKANHWYKLTYTLSSVTAGCTITIPGFTVAAQQARKYRSTATTWTFYIKAIGATTDFQLAVASTAGGFTLDTLVLEEMQNGDLFAHGGLSVREGANATVGSATLVAGTVTVNTNKVTANSHIFIQRYTAGGVLGNITYTKTAGTSFTINSDNALDTSVVDWFIVEPLI